MTLFDEGQTIDNVTGSTFEVMSAGISGPSKQKPKVRNDIPSYMHDVYEWAYVSPLNVRLLDREVVVSILLFGNSDRLQRGLLSEIKPDQRVLQAAHVYGGLIPRVAERIGIKGHLDVVDVVPIQAAHCQHKLKAFPATTVHIGDAAEYDNGQYDVVSSFFLLHEIPDEWKQSVVDNLLRSVAPGGRAVFVDYHGPSRWHPLRGVMRHVFTWLEPFAESLWRHEISDFATHAENFEWKKQTFFGGLYQKTVATHIANS